MIEALVSGKVYGQPAERTGQSGRRFVVAKVRAPVAEGESLFVSVIAFSDHVKAALLALADGDAVVLAGTLKVATWTNTEGVTQPKVDLIANDLLTTYHAKRKRAAVTGEAETPAAAATPRRGPAARAHGALHDDDL